ncbi:hypothetical protein CNX65_17640 [Actinosynnema pretiosum]|uniref:Uncharacterized protein n=1 Tax=Actinosynnema pretiosum TaxID=42197 RepID=A0A290Z781_9PSEU|nr:hypothetical protein CNX65_17640 [Actinosynnema pretiosum]
MTSSAPGKSRPCAGGPAQRLASKAVTSADASAGRVVVPPTRGERALGLAVQAGVAGFGHEPHVLAGQVGAPRTGVDGPAGAHERHRHRLAPGRTRGDGAQGEAEADVGAEVGELPRALDEERPAARLELVFALWTTITSAAVPDPSSGLLHVS